MVNSYEDVIAPPKRFVTIDWRELWRYRDLFLVLAWRDISVRYKQTAMGVAWAVFQPFISMVVFTLIFSIIFHLKSGDSTPYAVFVGLGQIFWLYFQGTLTDASNSMVTNAQMIQKIYFPRIIIPASAATTRLVDMAIASLLLVCIMLFYGLKPQLTGVLILPILLLCSITSALGLGLFLAAINVKYRDVRYALPFFIQIMMYVTPVIYPVTMLDGYPVAKTLMLWLNPMSGVITNARAGIVGNSPIDWYAMGASAVTSLVFLLFGLFYFRQTERYFADIV